MTSYQRVRNYTRHLASPFTAGLRYRITPRQRSRFRRKLRRRLRREREAMHCCATARYEHYDPQAQA